jgi:hypothetical protein
MPIIGTIVRAGTLVVDGEVLTGIFLECDWDTIRNVGKEKMYNARVMVTRADRRSADRVQGPAFNRIHTPQQEMVG